MKKYYPVSYFNYFKHVIILKLWTHFIIGIILYNHFKTINSQITSDFAYIAVFINRKKKTIEIFRIQRNTKNNHIQNVGSFFS